MDLDQLRTFLLVLEHGSFSRAAEEARIGQSTVSFQIKSLEKAIGTRLLDRRGGRVGATAAGSVLRRYAARILSLRDEALSRLRSEEAGQTGRVTIAASTIPAEYLVPAALAGFRKDRPKVDIVVRVSGSRQALATLLTQDCDLALVGAPVRDARIVATRFAEDDVVLVGPNPNPFAPSNRLTRAQLQQAPLILREEGSGTRTVVARFLARRAPLEGDLAPRIEVGSTEAAKRSAVQGLGLTFLSRFAVAEEIRAKRLSIVAVPGLPVRRRFYAAWLKSSTLSGAARAFLDVLLRIYR